jgi:hypothetical protein
MAPTCLSGSSMSTTCTTALRSRRYQVDRPITLPRNIWSLPPWTYRLEKRLSSDPDLRACCCKQSHPTEAGNHAKRRLLYYHCQAIAAPEMPPNIDMHISIDVLSCAPSFYSASERSALAPSSLGPQRSRSDSAHAFPTTWSHLTAPCTTSEPHYA